jgi:hypothetical protein
MEIQRFNSGPISREVMEEWREEMPELINKIDDEDLKAAFEKTVARIWQQLIN